MAMTYRTRMKVQRIGTAALVILTIIILVWLCWVIWLERYVVYTADGAEIRYEEQDFNGVPAVKPAAAGNVSIYYNEGSDSLDIGKELTAINGYYIDYNALSSDLEGVKDDLRYIKSGTPVMIELKGGYGSFYYSSNVSGSISSASVDIEGVDALITELQSRGFYLIAKISAFRDYNYGVNHVSSGLPLVGKLYLWNDSGGYYWLKPNDSAVLNYLTSIVLELKGMGFNEVVLADFRFPSSTEYSFTDDKQEALLFAVDTLMTACSSDTFTLGFATGDASFPLPDGRSRLYLDNVDAANVETAIQSVTLTDPETRVVFLCETNDTRFDQYSVLRPVSVAEALEAQKADQAGLND